MSVLRQLRAYAPQAAMVDALYSPEHVFPLRRVPAFLSQPSLGIFAFSYSDFNPFQQSIH